MAVLLTASGVNAQAQAQTTVGDRLRAGSTLTFGTSFSGTPIKPNGAGYDNQIQENHVVTINIAEVVSYDVFQASSLDSPAVFGDAFLTTTGNISFNIANTGNTPLTWNFHVRQISGGTDSFTYSYPGQNDVSSPTGVDGGPYTTAIEGLANPFGLDVQLRAKPTTPAGTYRFELTFTVPNRPDLTTVSYAQVTFRDILTYRTLTLTEPKVALSGQPTLHAVYYLNNGSYPLDTTSLKFDYNDLSSTTGLYSYAFVPTPYGTGEFDSRSVPDVPNIPAGTVFASTPQQAWMQANPNVQRNQVWALIVKVNTGSVDPSTTGLALNVTSTLIGPYKDTNNNGYDNNATTTTKLVTLFGDAQADIIVLMGSQICQGNNCQLLQRDGTRTLPGNLVRYSAQAYALHPSATGTLPAMILKLSIPANTLGRSVSTSFTSNQANYQDAMYRVDGGPWQRYAYIYDSENATIEAGIDSNGNNTIDAGDTLGENVNFTLNLEVITK